MNEDHNRRLSAPGSTPSLNDSGTAEPRGFSLPATQPVVLAVMVDAGFFLKRLRRLLGERSPEEAAAKLHWLARHHLYDPKTRTRASLYRIFVYDAPPATWKGHHPLTKKALDFSKSPVARWRLAFHARLRGMRKVALRLGELAEGQAQWALRARALKALANGRRQWSELTEEDFSLDLRQKGVDMRLGLDIASLAYKRQVNQIVLVAGDADFVPAAKLARREGIDFLLDPMWADIRPDLHEHIDGLRSVIRRTQASGPAASVAPGEETDG